MNKIIIANRKGGVAKSTTAVHLAAGLAMVGVRVLLIDTDTQGHCAYMLGVEPEKGLADVLDGSEGTGALYEARENLFLLAGGRNLAGISRLIARENIAPEKFMSKKLKQFDGQFDVAIIDGAPGFNELAINALVYATEAIIPVSYEILSVHGLSEFLQEIEEIEEAANFSLPYRILPTIKDNRVKKTEQIGQQLTDYFNGKVLEPIPYSAEVSRAPGQKKTLFEYAPKDRACHSYAILAGTVGRGL